MDYRKLIGFSNGSFVVTIPKNWVDKHKLKKGDMIGFEENNTEIVFYAGSEPPEKAEAAVTIDAKDKDLNMVKSEILNAYINNYSILEIVYFPLSENTQKIKSIIRNLSGMEIIEQTGSRLIAKDLIDVSSISVKDIVRRMDLITKSMIEDTLNCLSGKCNPQSLAHRDEDVNRLYYLGFRVIKNAVDNPIAMKKMKADPWQLVNDRSVLIRIEEIADAQKRISRILAESNFTEKTVEEFKEIHEAIKKRYSEVMKAYYNHDKKIAMEIEATNKEFVKKCNNFLEGIAKRVSEDIKKGRDAVKISHNRLTPASKVMEHTKATLGLIKHIGRAVLSLS